MLASRGSSQPRDRTQVSCIADGVTVFYYRCTIKRAGLESSLQGMVDDRLELGTKGSWTSEWSLQQSRYKIYIWSLIPETKRGGGEMFPKQDALCPLSNRTLLSLNLRTEMTLGSSPMPPSELQTPLLAPSLVPVASPRLLSQEAWVSLGAGLPLGEACRLGALQTDGRSGRIAEGLCAPCVHVC